MNDIIKSIEDAQLREVADFRTGDTVKVYGKVRLDARNYTTYVTV